MGVKIFDLVSNKNLEVKDLKNKIVVVMISGGNIDLDIFRNL